MIPMVFFINENILFFIYDIKFNNSAQIIKLLNKELPPYDMNGKATPTTGNIPIVIDIFIKNSKILNDKTNKIILLNLE